MYIYISDNKGEKGEGRGKKHRKSGTEPHIKTACHTHPGDREEKERAEERSTSGVARGVSPGGRSARRGGFAREEEGGEGRGRVERQSRGESRDNRMRFESQSPFDSSTTQKKIKSETSTFRARARSPGTHVYRGGGGGGAGGGAAGGGG